MLITQLVTVLLLLTAASGSHAFGAKGHRVSSLLAREHLTPRSATVLSEILGGESMAAASTWVDEMRSSSDNPAFWGYNHAANWHFINIPPGQSLEEADKNPRGDAYSALQAFTAVLENRPVPAGPVREALDEYFGGVESAPDAALKRLALRFVIHLVADLHQPLHVGYESDRGGNDIQVGWFGTPSNLHQIWDTHLVEYQDLSAAALARKLSRRIAMLPAAEVERIQRATPRQWVQESLVLRRDAYNVAPFGRNLGESYAEIHVPVVERQLIKAGLRLAALLNGIFD